MGVVVGNATGRGRGIVDISTLGDGFGCSTLRRPLDGVWGFESLGVID